MSTKSRNIPKHIQFYDYRDEDKSFFKAINISCGFFVPFCKPNIHEIIKTYSLADITWKKVLKTNIIGISLEGQKLTGCKLVVMGDIKYDIKYSVSDISQPLNTLNVTIPFSSYITLPKYVNHGSFISVSTDIEDVYIEKFDSRYAYTNITINIVADVY